MAIPKRCVGSKVCVLQFSIFSCAHLGSSARNLSKRPKWSTYVESKVIGVKSLCLEGLVNYLIQAEDIIIYLCAFQGTFGFFSPILLFFARHDVKWRPCISALRSIDIMTQVCFEGRPARTTPHSPRARDPVDAATHTPGLAQPPNRARTQAQIKPEPHPKTANP